MPAVETEEKVMPDQTKDVQMAMAEVESHGHMMLCQWDKFLALIHEQASEYLVDGESLDLATVVAVARYGVSVAVDEKTSPRVEQSAKFLKSCLTDGQCIYGVNTGFGGSADTRTDKVDKLQRTLISFLNCGVLAMPMNSSTKTNGYSNGGRNGVSKYRGISTVLAGALPNEDPITSTFMPEAWVKSSLLVRCNSLAAGNSGVRPELIRSLVDLLKSDIIPAIPLRGSVSASGDLIPLSYIAGALEGSPGVYVWNKSPTGGRELITADVALSKSSLAPLRLGPKEGLAIVNGTAVSASVGVLALHDAHYLAVLSQVLTAMGVEALRGNSESFDPFLAVVRPHAGQIEASRNIRKFLAGSRLVTTNDHDVPDDGSLRQDRYSTRTTPQWIGPQLEDLMLAHKQLAVEINSTTDNPIIDAKGGKLLHGGNFQAMSVTSAMEKARSALQCIGRMLFAQCTELVNPALNNGLPPNLTADEPSLSFLLKGVDISVAALQAELGLLSNPVQPHMQNAEMGNQSLNSLALLSARYTHMALDILSQISAAYLLTLCQALDLRVLHIRFVEALQPAFVDLTTEVLGPVLQNVNAMHEDLWLHFERELSKTTTMDSAPRFAQVTESMQTTILAFPSVDDAELVPAMREWTHRCHTLIYGTYHATRDAYAAIPDPCDFLGFASSRMYNFVRKELKVPFQAAQSTSSRPPAKWVNPVSNTGTIGSLTTKIYTAIRTGALYVPVMQNLRDACKEENAGATNGLKRKFEG